MSDSESAASNLGPHLLGRVPSPPDSRDYALGDYLGTDADIVNKAIEELKQTTVGYAGHTSKWPGATTHWGKAMSLLRQVAPVNPTPPSPSPTPTGDVVYADNEPVLDQGQFGTCTGNGAAQFLNTNPIDDKFTEGMGQSAKNRGPYARALYYEATVNDGQPDDPEAPNGGQQGATVRSVMKALAARGRIGAYVQTQSLNEIKQWLQSGKGTLVVGTDWLNDMFSPNSSGYVTPTGPVEGGHCYLLTGDLESEGAFLFQNSWGSSWGLNGRFKMKYADFQKLIDSGGEVWSAVELAL